MKKLITVLIIAVAALLVGSVLFGIGLVATGGSPSGNRTVEHESIVGDGDVNKISVEYDVADIVVTVSDTAESVSIEYPITKNKDGEPTSEITAVCRDGVLSVSEETIWHKNLFVFGLEEATVRVTLPKGKELELSLGTDTGSITLGSGVTASSAELSTDTGSIVLEGATVGGKLDVETDTGSINIKGAVSAAEIDLSVDTGRITVSADMTADSVNIEADTGRVTVTASLRAKKLMLKTATGDVNASGVIDAESLEIRASTGDLDLLLYGERELYTVTAETSTGDSNILSGGSGERKLSVKTNTGDIKISFAK